MSKKFNIHDWQAKQKQQSLNEAQYGVYFGKDDEYQKRKDDMTPGKNPDYFYEAKDSDPPSLKRKVIRGGSWKDIGYYLQTGTRTYEYQDTAKCYVGFRTVMTFLGRDKADF